MEVGCLGGEFAGEVRGEGGGGDVLMEEHIPEAYRCGDPVSGIFKGGTVGRL